MNRFYSVFKIISLILFISGCSFFSENDEKKSKVEEFSSAEKLNIDIAKSEKWQVYDNPDIGFSLKYPKNIRLLAESEYPDSKNYTYLKVELKEIGYFETPMEFSKEDAMKTIEALSAGEFGLEYDFPLSASKKVRTVGFLFAQDFLVLARFDMCDVCLERKLLFYFNNKQIVITIFGPVNKLKEAMPEYFTADKDNCGSEKRWDFDKLDTFYQTLEKGNAPTDIQIWYNQFNELSESILFAHR